ncbi:ubiquitin carboxyl-terminal hydrolase 26-like [Xenopus tropicalis]|uniref:Ubiquitin carboxyl-terminal hydrolase 26-like n=1 Tax=Xenopus tropicalis TaxID=8364 RepID=A0A8J1IUX0_XENTR|nr:ubiquitin carboxyl-terminal hydrolase 26-like [Xenopus tropicalis]
MPWNFAPNLPNAVFWFGAAASVCTKCFNFPVLLTRILIVQLKRFWFDYETLETEKLYEEVEVSLSLTVSPYCTERTSLPLPRPEMDSNVKEKKTKISRKAMKKSTKEDKFQSYNLVSIVNHIGDGAEDGHYVSDVYDDKTKTWLTYDDSDVNEMDPEAMLATRAYTGYLYFYIHKSFLNVK